MQPTGLPGWIVLGSLASTAVAGLALTALGDWGAAPGTAAVVVSVVAASVVALAALWRGQRWPAVLALAWAGLVGLVMVGLGAPPEPWAADMPLPPAAIEALAFGGPRVSVGVVWVASAMAGIRAVACARRTRRRLADRA